MVELCHKCGLVYHGDYCECSSCSSCGVKLMSNESKICASCVSAQEHISDLGWDLTDEEKYGNVPFYNSLEEYVK
ncbi:hypothetical protein LCGC14_0488750 [marine sediment metagenome]|uniref:Uncharacterized protein n=1 Tax=marine sediment metagenome TaxID=412755 RepID=A0A0F9VG07_9ZZZZ